MAQGQYGVSWQIVPSALIDMSMTRIRQVAGVMTAILPMKKIDIRS